MKVCSIDGCDSKHYGKGFCSKHYRQFKIHGVISERTIFTPNEIIVDGTICKMKLYNKSCEEIAETIFDVEDLHKVSLHKWNLKPDGYVLTNNGRNKGQTKLHNLLMDITKSSIENEIDHINRNKLDNRKSNLRIVTRFTNIINRKLNKNNTSKHRGIRFRKEKNKYEAYITKNYKYITCGLFNSMQEAIKARHLAEIKYFGQAVSVQN